jgi:hypothetical protein
MFKCDKLLTYLTNEQIERKKQQNVLLIVNPKHILKLNKYSLLI